jgi:hypothetical protein
MMENGMRAKKTCGTDATKKEEIDMNGDGEGEA